MSLKVFLPIATLLAPVVPEKYALTPNAILVSILEVPLPIVILFTLISLANVPPAALKPPEIPKTPEPGSILIPDVPPETILPFKELCSNLIKSFALEFPLAKI